MDEYALTVERARAGPVRTIVVRGDLDLSETAWFLTQAALAVDDQAERLVFDLAGVTFLDCAGVRALMVATGFAPEGCPVIIRSLSPIARRILDVLDVDLGSFSDVGPGEELGHRLHDGAPGQQLSALQISEPDRATTDRC